jgi:hypothetical protein
VDATFTITSPAGTITGTKRFEAGKTHGSGTCDDMKQASSLHAAGVVYTAKLPDGTVDQGVVEMGFTDVPVSASNGATFVSTGRIADADGDGWARTTARSCRTATRPTVTATASACATRLTTAPTPCCRT